MWKRTQILCIDCGVELENRGRGFACKKRCDTCNNAYRKEYAAAMGKKYREDGRYHDYRNAKSAEYRADGRYKENKKKLQKKYRDDGRYKEYQKQKHAQYRQEGRYRDYLAGLYKTDSYKMRNKKKKQDYRAKQKALPKTMTVQNWRNALEYFDNRCVYCGSVLQQAHQEHFVPLSRGGGYTKDNIVPACPTCNKRKSNKNPLDWLVMQAKGLVAYARVIQYLER